MRPIDFVVFDGDSDPNTPVYAIAAAMKKDIRVFGSKGEYVILSYYYDDEGQMILEIERKKK